MEYRDRECQEDGRKASSFLRETNNRLSSTFIEGKRRTISGDDDQSSYSLLANNPTNNPRNGRVHSS